MSHLINKKRKKLVIDKEETHLRSSKMNQYSLKILAITSLDKLRNFHNSKKEVRAREVFTLLMIGVEAKALQQNK